MQGPSEHEPLNSSSTAGSSCVSTAQSQKLAKTLKKIAPAKATSGGVPPPPSSLRSAGMGALSVVR